MMNDYVLLFSGIVCAAFGGELFVRGMVCIASVLRIAPSIIAVTVAAFATSSPELSVAINSGLAGKSQLSLGDALGSNIVNISLVLGFTLLISGIPVGKEVLKRDAPVAILVPFLTAIFLIDNIIDRLEGLFMLIFFGAWMATTSSTAFLLFLLRLSSSRLKFLSQRSLLYFFRCPVVADHPFAASCQAGVPQTGSDAGADVLFVCDGAFPFRSVTEISIGLTRTLCQFQPERFMNIAALFIRCAIGCDRDRSKLLPCFDQFYGVAMRMISFPSDAPFHVLDLGSGTGLFASMAAEAYPNALLRLTDISEAMLDVVRQRFAGNSQISFTVQEHLGLIDGSAFDLVMSFKIFRALSPGGIFINAGRGSCLRMPVACRYCRQWRNSRSN